MLYPLTFHPIFKERVWGGGNLERVFQKELPPDVPIGESWEISDRSEDESVIANGTLAGKSLRWLMENHRSELLGASTAEAGRFPLLIKPFRCKCIRRPPSPPGSAENQKRKCGTSRKRRRTPNFSSA